MSTKFNVSAFAKLHHVSRMTVLRRIKAGELKAEKFVIEKARDGRPARYEWLIWSDADFAKYRAGRPPKQLEIEKVIGKKPPRRPSAVAGTGGKAISIFGRR